MREKRIQGLSKGETRVRNRAKRDPAFLTVKAGPMAKRKRAVFEEDSDADAEGPMAALLAAAAARSAEVRAPGSRTTERGQSSLQVDSGAEDDDDDDDDDVLRRRAVPRRAPGSRAKERRPATEIGWKVFATTQSGSAVWLDEQLTRIMRSEKLPEHELKGKGWKATQKGTTWRRIFYCPFSRRQSVNCEWRLRLTVEGAQRDKDAALVGEYTIEIGDIPHADHNKSGKASEYPYPAFAFTAFAFTNGACSPSNLPSNVCAYAVRDLPCHGDLLDGRDRAEEAEGHDRLTCEGRLPRRYRQRHAG
jgi:hypothetical protein